LIVLPFALCLRMLEFGGGNGPLSRKGLAESWSRLGRNTRNVLRLTVVRPLRGVMWVMRRVVAIARRATRRVVYWILMAPRRILRLFRHVRYHVAVRLRGHGQA
jgi:hypothetical protein